VRAIGGNTQNRLLMAIKAAVYGRPIAAADMPEATALGAALLGGLAAGVFQDLAAAVAGLATTYRTFEPRAHWVERYEAHYRHIYQPAYARLRPLHHAAAALEAGC
jgi:xylulokinase